MMNSVRCLMLATMVSLLMPAFICAQEDKPGSKDYPLFSRWPGYYFDDYAYKKFDAYTYQLKDSKETVEGEHYYLYYFVKNGVEPATDLEIIRNYENAIRKAKGTVLYTHGNYRTVGKIIMDGKEIWVQARSWYGGKSIELNHSCPK